MSKKILNIYKPNLTQKRKVYCSPTHKNNNYSCFNKSALLRIAKSWNKNSKTNKIKIHKNDTSKKLWDNINARLNNKCNGEWCWIKQKFVKSLSDNDINNTFRPETPKDWYKSKTEWLSTLDIDNVMEQYQDKYKDFLFIGAVPMDFDYKTSDGHCIINELCRMNLNSLKKRKKKRIGIVFNLDKHYENGSHWVAMFIDLNKNEIYYWDSYGEKPNKEIKVLVKRLQSQAKKNNYSIKYKENKIRHQYKYSECGVYCMYFITKLLQGKSFEDIINNKVSDVDMNMKRGYYYSPNCS